MIEFANAKYNKGNLIQNRLNDMAIPLAINVVKILKHINQIEAY